MTEGSLEVISQGHGLLEGPVWDEDRGLLVADAVVGGVWAFKNGAPPSLIVPHRRGIGGMDLHADGGLVVSGRNVAFKRFVGNGVSEETTPLFESDANEGRVGFNDLTVDAVGRIYVGSLAFVAMSRDRTSGKPGNLYRIDLDGSVRAVAEDILLTNGLGFSPDGRRLYHSDSFRTAVHVYDVAADGSLGPKETFATIEDGVPDGLAVDSTGAVWVAVAEGSRVSAFDTRGKEISRIPVPVPMVTSLCFGGEDYRDLFIVSGSEGQATDRGGGIYRMRTQVRGMARPKARVPVGGAGP